MSPALRATSRRHRKFPRKPVGAQIESGHASHGIGLQAVPAAQVHAFEPAIGTGPVLAIRGFVQSPQHFGIRLAAPRAREPSSPLLPTHSPLRLSSPASSSGSDPVRSLSLSHSQPRRPRPPSSRGMEPVRSLSWSCRERSSARSPSAAGNVPSRPLSRSRTAVTRPVLSATIPYHSSTGSSLTQLSFRVQSGPPVALYSATSASRSVAWTNAPTRGFPTRPARLRLSVYTMSIATIVGASNGSLSGLPTAATPSRSPTIAAGRAGDRAVEVGAVDAGAGALETGLSRAGLQQRPAL